MKVFKGTHGNRPNMTDVSAPDHMDYVILVREIAQTQEKLLAFAENVDLGPNLGEKLREFTRKFEQLSDKIARLSPPDDLMCELNRLKDDIKGVDSRRALIRVKERVETLNHAVNEHHLEVLRVHSSFQREVRGFQNRMEHRVAKFEKEVTERLAKLEKQMVETRVSAEILTMLDRLKD